MNVIDGKQVYSVSEVNYAAKETLEQLEVWVMGEVSQVQQNPNWYYNYIKLVDENSVLPAICTRDVLAQVTELVPGQKVLLYGFPTILNRKGEFKFKILRIEAAGEGLLQKQLEELIKKLKGEGLFDAQHKKEIPLYPKKVCLVTSQGSDAWNDFKRHSIDKFPIIEFYTKDVRVQGSQSIPQLLKVLPTVDKMGFDVIVITRGGGSLEDLAAFNDEKVARAIFALQTPTVVAIGHEANESLAEWVADRRASTPTDAANIVTFGYNQVLEKLESQREKLILKSNYFFMTNFQRLDQNFRSLARIKSSFKDLPHKLARFQESISYLQMQIVNRNQNALKELRLRLKMDFKNRYDQNLQNLKNLEKSLRLLSPENTLARGYAIATDDSGKVLRSTKGVVLGDTVGVRLVDGTLGTIVKNKS